MKVTLPKDIKRYKSKFIAGLTLRQFVFVVFGLIAMVLWGYILSRFMDFTLACMLAVILSLPVFLLGFLTVSGLTFEKVIARIIRSEIQGKDYRPYRREGFK